MGLESRGAALVAALALPAFASCAARLPPISWFDKTHATAPAGAAAASIRCDTLLVSHALQIPPDGELTDLRLLIERIPAAEGSLRVLVHRPAFDAGLELESLPAPKFDALLELTPRQELALVLLKPPGADRSWPRENCHACRVEVEVSGLFGVKEAYDAFLALALREAAEIETGFSSQSTEPASHPSAALQKLGASMIAESHRCGGPAMASVTAVLHALELLDGARAATYAGESPKLSDPLPVLKAFETASADLALFPIAATAARDASWPAALKARDARFRWSVTNLELVHQVLSLPVEERAAASRWIAVALAPDDDSLERHIAMLPPLRDLADAQARLTWIDPARTVKLPLRSGSEKSSLIVPRWRAVRRGPRCFGPSGAGPSSDPQADTRVLAKLLGADENGHLRIAKLGDLPAARAWDKRTNGLLCRPPNPDLEPLFAGLDSLELARLEAALRPIIAAAGPAAIRDAIGDALVVKSAELVCRVFAPQSLAHRAGTVEAYRSFVSGGEGLLALFEAPPACDGTALTGAEARRRLRVIWREDLDGHADRAKLCPSSGGRCPGLVAASVQRIFKLASPELSVPVTSSIYSLESPPPFGFSDSAVHRLARCSREACETLARLKSQAPAGQFDGLLCSDAGSELPAPEVHLERADLPGSLRLGGCAPRGSERVRLLVGKGVTGVISIASPQPFEWGKSEVTRASRHPQLGPVYERTVELGAPGLPRKSDGVYEAKLKAKAEGQVFYFFVLQRRD